jgi:hypothetical protein
MAAEPINIFSCKIDPRGVVRVLRSLAPSLQVIGPEDCWKKIIISTSRGWLRKPIVLAFLHNPDYYDGPDWPRQRLGMQGYFSRFPETSRKADLLRLIGTFRFSLATEFEPDRGEVKDDDRLSYILAVTKHLDGVVFTPSSLRDAEGRILIAADGETDPAAVMPNMPVVVQAPDEEAADSLDASDDDTEPEPPTPLRVARRALVLAAVAGRALLEQEDTTSSEVKAHSAEIIAWVSALDLKDEIEPEEWKVLQRPPGTLDQQATINSTWRLEGLGVLAWALGRFDLPPYDELVNPGELLRSLSFLDSSLAPSLIATAALRDDEALESFNRQMLAFHWRIRDFTLRPQPMDFDNFSRNSWFGGFDMTPFRLLNDDLALGDHPISEAPRDVFARAQSAAMERHLASNWLVYGGKNYSETDTST